MGRHRSTREAERRRVSKHPNDSGRCLDPGGTRPLCCALLLHRCKPLHLAVSSAIRAAVARATRKLGRPPVVLDIGAGTGLLGLMVARAGAKHVYSAEANRPLAQVSVTQP